MSLTARQLVTQMLQYCGVTSLDPTDASNTGVLGVGLSDGLVDAAITCVNAALQEILVVSPISAYKRRFQTVLQAPKSVTLSLTSGSDLVVVTGWEEWMNGCTVKIGGEVTVNEFISAAKLRRPWSGATGSYGATVYNDCIQLPGGIVDVPGPIEIPQVRRMVMTSSREEFAKYEWNRIYGTDYGFTLARFSASPKVAAQPVAAYVDSETINGVMKRRIYLLPVPDHQYYLQYTVTTDAFQITATDVGTTTDPEVSFNIPGGWEESVLLPMALKRFSANPNFGTGNPLLQSEIARQHAMARDILQRVAPNRASTMIQCNFR